MAYTWQEFIDGVILLLTDKQPDDAAFFEAQAEYVRARLASELRGDKDGYSIHQNRYTSLRRKLSGYVTTQNAAAQRSAVRLLVSDVTPDNNLFALACSYWIKAHTVTEVNRNAEEGGTWLGMYRAMRLRLLGYTHTFADYNTLANAVKNFLAVDMTAENLENFLNANLNAAVSDLQGLAGWFNQQVAAAQADLEALHERVQREIRAAVIMLQQHVKVYCVGQSSTFVEGTVTPDGAASRGVMPEGAAVREAWMAYPDPDDEDADTVCRRRECVRIPWEDRHSMMICADACYPTIAFDPYGQDFLVAPALLDGAIELELKWDGLRITFEPDDVVPLDESAMEAVALRVQSALAMEFGDGVTVARDYERKANQKMGFCFIAGNDRKRMAVERQMPGGFPCCGGCSTSSGTTPAALSGYEEIAITGAGESEIAYHARLKTYHVLARVQEGSAPYAYDIVLKTADRTAGNEISILVALPASTNPTLRIIDEASGTAWVDFTHDGEAGWFRGDFTFDGTGWSSWGWNPVGNGN